MADINIGAIAEQLNYKVDLDMHNSQKPYIVETYDDGQGNGYRVWSNKWCEQWGNVNGNSSDWRATITFTKEYKDTNYVINSLSGRNDGNDNYINNNCFVNRFSTTGARIALFGDGISTKLWWKAEGYIL